MSSISSIELISLEGIRLTKILFRHWNMMIIGELLSITFGLGDLSNLSVSNLIMFQ